MLNNFITIAIRSFLRQRLYSFINLLGLASGLSCTLLIYLWVNDELQVDRYHQDIDKLFRIVSTSKLSDGDLVTWTETPGPLAEDIRENIKEVELAARTVRNGDHLFQYEDKNFLESGVFGDPDLFKVLTFTILSGSPPPQTLEKNWVAISHQLSEKLFGDANPIGKTVKVGSKYDLTVSTVFADLGSESSIHFDYILPFEIYRDIRGEYFTWGNFDHQLYLKLLNSDQSNEVIEKINQSTKQNFEPEDRDAISFYMQPFKDKYLYAGFENGLPVPGRIKYVIIFSIVAIFILTIACINFMNMATARAVIRAKEVGVRKVVGAQRINLIAQFMAESLLISALSMIIAIAFVYLILPLFNLMMAKNIMINFNDPFLLISILLIVAATGVLAGTYPALFLSSYTPVSVLKGNMYQSLSGDSLRKILVVFQFAITVVLIISALIVYDQVEYIRNKNLGYQRENILTFVGRGNVGKQFDAFRNEVSQLKGVKAISRSNQMLANLQNQTGSVSWPGMPDNNQQLFRVVVVDLDFLETLQLELAEGRFFSRNFNDTSNFVLSQRAVEIMGLTDPVGQSISLWGSEGTIVGVVNDFHSRSLHEAIDPIIFKCQPNNTWIVNVRIEGNQTNETLGDLESIYKKFSPEYPFGYSFLDNDFERLYSNEKIAGRLALTFTVMAILISGLGLIGLAAYTVERRKKEIGIRKTMGAEVSAIISLIFKDFIRLCLIAVAIGCPLAYYLMNLFLDGFAYHTTIRITLFITTAFVMIIFTISVVIFQVSKAAMANPVDTLRNE